MTSTPKEKAKELIDKYLNASFNCKDCDMPYCDIPCTSLNLIEAKECALITIDEIIKANPYTVKNMLFNAVPNLIYWQQVRKQIELL